GSTAIDHLNGGTNDTYSKNARFTLKTWTGQETELGTLKTYTETRFNYPNGGASSVSLNFAWIQLGGFRIGQDESAFDTFQGYAGNVIDDTIVPYGPFTTNVVQYYFDGGNGFSAVVSLEEGSNITSSRGANAVHDYTIDSYVPHVVVGAKYTQGWGGISAVAAYDSVHEEWAGKVRLDVNATEQLSLFLMAGYGTDNNPKTGQDFNYYKLWDGNWAVWGGGTYKFNEKASFNLQASYDEGKTFGLAANVAYELVPGFTITTELDYMNQSASVYHASDDAFGGIIRFQRDF
ncbi:MAG: porin, partial [Mesorhizobium sp.]